METVAELLKHKGSDVVTVAPDASVFEALKIMESKNIGAVLVVDEEGEVSGIMTERDYARKVILRDRSSRSTPVTDIMTREVVIVRPGSTVEEAMAIMTRKRCRHLPVVENGELAGLISIGDVVKALINEKEFVIDQLEHYIAGSL